MERRSELVIKSGEKGCCRRKVKEVDNHQKKGCCGTKVRVDEERENKTNKDNAGIDQ